MVFSLYMPRVLRLATPHWTVEDTEDGTTSAISWEQASLGLLLPFEHLPTIF